MADKVVRVMKISLDVSIRVENINEREVEPPYKVKSGNYDPAMFTMNSM